MLEVKNPSVSAILALLYLLALALLMPALLVHFVTCALYCLGLGLWSGLTRLTLRASQQVSG